MNKKYDIDIDIQVKVRPMEVPSSDDKVLWRIAESIASFQGKILAKSFEDYLHYFVDDYLNQFKD